MKIAVGADENLQVVEAVVSFLEGLGHSVDRFGAAASKVEPWGVTAVLVAESVARGDHDAGVVCCFTGTGVSIAANKVPGIRAALCADAQTARGARRWNDANVLALSLRRTTAEIAREILEAWLAEPYGKTEEDSLRAITEREAHSSDEPSKSSAK